MRNKEWGKFLLLILFLAYGTYFFYKLYASKGVALFWFAVVVSVQFIDLWKGNVEEKRRLMNSLQNSIEHLENALREERDKVSDLNKQILVLKSLLEEERKKRS